MALSDIFRRPDGLYRFLLRHWLGIKVNTAFESARHEILELINAASHKIRIVSGELNCSIYNNEDSKIVEALRTKAEKEEVLIEILCGPTTDICESHIH